MWRSGYGSAAFNPSSWMGDIKAVRMKNVLGHEPHTLLHQILSVFFSSLDSRVEYAISQFSPAKSGSRFHIPLQFLFIFMSLDNFLNLSDRNTLYRHSYIVLNSAKSRTGLVFAYKQDSQRNFEVGSTTSRAGFVSI